MEVYEHVNAQMLMGLLQPCNLIMSEQNAASCSTIIQHLEIVLPC